MPRSPAATPHLVTHSDVSHLLLVGAYRDNEVGPAHPLVRTLDAIREAGAENYPRTLGDKHALVSAEIARCTDPRRPRCQLGRISQPELDALYEYNAATRAQRSEYRASRCP